jgi:omega-hydroxy-beta-dihydromenaquinone-9 sulfotransferase
VIYFHSSFYYVRYGVLFKCWKQVLFGKRFTLKLFLFSSIFTILFFLHQLLNLIFRAIDEIIFFKYRKIQIKAPVFIIANPRSGTTLLHHLMSNHNRYAYMKLSHTIFPSVSFSKLYRLLSSIDRKIGNLIVKTFKRVDNALYGGWKNIHPLGFNKTEEDEAIYTLAFTSPAVFLLFPYLHLINENWLLDNEPEHVKKQMMNYYENSVKRFMYANGNDKIYLSKNVLSSGRINSLLERFPDAKIIYLARNPYEALPSFISMFGVMYHVHSPYIKNNDAALQAWAWLGIAFYKHMYKAMKKMADRNLCMIKYDDLVAHPQATVENIYGKLNMPLSTDFELKLAAEELKNKTYRSKHHYSLDQYGLSKEIIYDELKFIFDEFGFEK